MKVLSTDGLTKLIQLVKSAFIKVEDVIETQEITLADVATTGDFDDLINQPTIPDTSNLANKDLSNLSSTGNAKFQAPLVSGTNIKTINNNSILGSGNLTLDGLPSQTGQSGKFLTTDGTDASWATVTIPSIDIDNKSITTNLSDELQTVGVIDQNNTSNAIKTWTGTKAEYDAINTTTTTTLLYAWTSGTTTVYTTTATPVAWEDNICDANGTINTVELISSVSSDFTTITTSNEGSGGSGSGIGGGPSDPDPDPDPNEDQFEF